LEIVCTARYRGFESLSLRHKQSMPLGLAFISALSGRSDPVAGTPLRAELIAGSRATVGYEPRQIRKEATVVADSVCRGGAQLSVVPAKSPMCPSPFASARTEPVVRC
jgi:hypothetical protein